MDAIMNKRKVRLTFILSSLLITIISLGFNAIMNMDTFKKSVTESLVAGYNVAGGEAVRKIEYAVKYGKPLENFYGINDLLKEVKETAEDIDDVRLIQRDGSVLYAIKSGSAGTALQSSLLAKATFSGGSKYAYTLKDGTYYLFLNLRDRTGQQIGSLAITFAEKVVRQRAESLQSKSILVVVFFGLIAAIALAIFFMKVQLFDEAGEIRRKKITAFIVCVLASAQLISVFVNVIILNNAYVDMIKANTSLTAAIIQKDINQVVEKGVTYDEVYEVESWMKKIIQNVPQLEKIYIADSSGKILKSTAAASDNRLADPQYVYRIDLKEDASRKVYSIGVILSKEYIKQKLVDIILDALTLLLTSFFLMLELVLFLIIFLHRKARSINVLKGGKPPLDGNIIRTLAFLFFIANNIAVSFVPVMMKNFYKPLWGLPENVVIALPTTMEMMGTIITTMIAGYIIDRKGWKYPFYAGLVFVCTGMLLCGLSADQLMFILARFVIGIGYGLCWMSMRGFVAGLPDEEGRANGFSSLSAGIYAGINCGCVIGGMLAERIGYSGVFFVGLAMISLSGIFVMTFMRDMLPGGLNKNVKEKKEAKNTSTVKFFLNGEIASFFLLMIIPTSLFYMFLSYFFPLYAKGQGISSANTSRAILVYGICIVYLGPVLGKYLFSRFNTRRIMFVSNVILIAAMLVFAINGGFWFAVLSLLLLGLGDSVGSPAQNSYFLSLDAAQAQGRGKVLGFYSVVKKVGNMVGPMAFGWATAFAGMQKGVGIIGIIGVAALVVYVGMTLIRRRSVNRDVYTGIQD